MKIPFALLLLALSNLNSLAQAPNSLVGKIFRYHVQDSMFRTSREETITLEAESRCRSLVNGSGNYAIPNAPYRIFLNDPSNDGTFTYQRTGESTAKITLLLNRDGNVDQSSVYFLTFVSASTGTLDNEFHVASGKFQVSDPTTSAPLVNLSLRGNVAPGRPLIAGFVVSGTEERELLIRVIGPTLSNFNVANAWADPDFALYRSAAVLTTEQIHYSDWSVSPNFPSAAGFKKIFVTVGAFPLPEGSKDAAQIARLAPGAYSIVCSAPAGDTGGEALIEVYTLP